MNFFVVLGAYNEEKGIGALLKNLVKIHQGRLPELKVLIVNDGSHDRTSEIARSFANQIPLELIEFNQNRGIVEVFRTAFQKVVEQAKDNDYCITMDADNTHPPEVIFKIIEKLRQGDDIAIASRFEPDGGVVGAPPFRAFLSNTVAFLLQRIVGIPGVKDYSTFYRGYRVSLLRKGLAVYGDSLVAGEGFAGMAGLLIRLSHLTRNIGEVALVLRYDLKEGRSGMKIYRTTLGYFKLFAQHLRGQLRPSRIV